MFLSSNSIEHLTLNTVKTVFKQNLINFRKTIVSVILSNMTILYYFRLNFVKYKNAACRQ